MSEKMAIVFSVGKRLRHRELLGRILVTVAETSLGEGSREACWSLRACGLGGHQWGF